MLPDALQHQIQQDRQDGLIPCFVSATIGTTSSNALDPLPEIGRICKEENVWLHVDGAMSGTAAVCPEFRYIQEGIEFADSYAFNPHKWMFTNFDCDCFFVADRAILIQTLSILPEYLRNQATESGAVIDYRDWHIQLGRRFRSLKLWFVIRHYGIEGHPDPSGRTRCLAAGCSVYLKKPAQPDELYRAVQSAIETTPRQNVRVETFLKASVDGSGTGAEFVTMLSDQGLFVKTLHPKPAGRTHGVSFILNRKIIKVQAQVLYSYRFGEGPGKEPGMGMKFVTIEPADLALVQAYVQSSISAGTPQDKTR